MGQVLRRLLEVFYTKKLDIVVIGLENRWVSEWDQAAVLTAVTYLLYSSSSMHDVKDII